ncbi:MAG: HAD family phosphatase, partial [Planctomycetes bacterium]|nr:HAD family phosphatase [Planctomycetota bacterium]
MPQFAALLLDLDGTLVDSEPRHFQAHREFLTTKGITVTEDDLAGNVGKGDGVFYQLLAEKRGVTADIAAWVAAKSEVLLGMYRRDGLPARPGAMRLLDHARDEGVCACVVTNSERRVAVAALTAAGLAERLPLRVCYEDTHLHKPDPAPYLLAARRLGVPASRCLAIED